MRLTIYNLFVLTFLFCSYSRLVQAQNNVDEYLQRLNLNQALYPSQDILKTRSVVVLSLPMDNEANERQEILDEMQLFFAEVGIDAVAYLDVERYDIRQNTPEAYPDFLFKRGIENLIILTAPDIQGPYFLAIAKFNNTETLYDRGSPAFARYTNKLTTVWEEMGSYFKTDQFQRTNLLVNESPEFFYPQVDLGIVARSVPLQVAEFKIAIRPIDFSKYASHPIFKIQHHNLFSPDSIQDALRARENALLLVSEDSTNTLELVDIQANTAELRRSGFIYELQFVKGSEELVHEWIPFPNRTGPTQEIVYKFYLKDLRTNTIYIGKEWDASPDWFEGFNRFLAQINQAAATRGG